MPLQVCGGHGQYASVGSSLLPYRSQVSNKIVKTVKLGSKKLSLSTDPTGWPLCMCFVLDSWCVLLDSQGCPWTHDIPDSNFPWYTCLTLVTRFLSNLWNKWIHVSFKALQSSHFLFIQFLPRKLALGITKIRKLALLYYHANCRHHVAHTNHLFLRVLFCRVLNFIDVLIHVPTTVIRKQHGQISWRTLSPTAVSSLPPWRKKKKRSASSSRHLWSLHTQRWENMPCNGMQWPCKTIAWVRLQEPVWERLVWWHTLVVLALVRQKPWTTGSSGQICATLSNVYPSPETQANERFCLRKQDVQCWGGILSVDLWSPHTCTYMCTHMLVHPAT